MNKPEDTRLGERLLRILRSESSDTGWFSPVFLKAVAPQTLERILRSLRDRHGVPLGVRRRGPGWELAFASATVPVSVSWDDDGRVTGLLLGAAQTTGATVEEVLAEFATVAEETSYLVLFDGEERWARFPDRRVDVASAFKLALLAALRREIDSGRRSWSDIAYLRAGIRSLPTGLLQDWPEGAPFTLHTLSTLMISRSDNTATDILLDVLGRAAVEEHCPALTPIATTREYFVLSAKSNRQLSEQYVHESSAGRRRILEEAARLPLPSVAELRQDESAGQAGWRLSPRELCSLMESVADLPLMAVEPGPARWGAWERVAFKGGASFTTRSSVLCLEAGEHRCYVATLAHSRLDETRVDSLNIALVRALESAWPRK
jgi:hypothetical protein